MKGRIKNPNCIDCGQEMDIDKHIKAKERREYKPKARAAIHRFKCSLCGYFETVYAWGQKDYNEGNRAIEDSNKMFENQKELNEL